VTDGGYLTCLSLKDLDVNANQLIAQALNEKEAPDIGIGSKSVKTKKSHDCKFLASGESSLGWRFLINGISDRAGLLILSESSEYSNTFLPLLATNKAKPQQAAYSLATWPP
jgi:hypothetical protein